MGIFYNTNQGPCHCLLGGGDNDVVFLASLDGKIDYGRYHAKCRQSRHLILAIIGNQKVHTD